MFDTKIVHIFNICKYSNKQFVAYFENVQLFTTFTKIRVMAGSKKQERAIVHLEKDGRHYYYGNLKALTDHWPKDSLGVSYSYLKNLNITEEKPYINDKCTIRRGYIITSSRCVSNSKEDVD